jgi:hypothetical protein
LKKPTYSYGIIRAAVGVVAIPGMMIMMIMHGTALLPATVYAQNSTNSTMTTPSQQQQQQDHCKMRLIMQNYQGKKR